MKYQEAQEEILSFLKTYSEELEWDIKKNRSISEKTFFVQRRGWVQDLICLVEKGYKPIDTYSQCYGTTLSEEDVVAREAKRRCVPPENIIVNSSEPVDHQAICWNFTVVDRIEDSESRKTEKIQLSP